MQINTATMRQRKSIFIWIAAVCLVLVCLLSVLSKTAFAQTTYVITDGETTTVYTTNLSNPAEVLNEAGHALEDGDLYITQATSDGATEIVVQRLQYITVNNCGKNIATETYGETVNEVLTRLGIPTYGDYRISYDLEVPTFDGMVIDVTLMQQLEQTYSVEIPFEINYTYDSNLAEGDEIVIIPGKIGQPLRTDSVLFENGIETSRTTLEETVNLQPTNQFVLKGTGENVGSKRTKPLIGDGFIVTTDNKILTFSHSQQFLATAYTHTDAGCDMITSTGTTVRIGTVAVDPRVIPYFTEMYIVTNDGSYVYGMSRAEDCGGSIKGDRLDLYFPTTAECFQFGMRDCTVYFLTDAE